MAGADELLAMGYSQAQADQALQIAGGDLEQAIGFLLMGEQSRAGFDVTPEMLTGGGGAGAGSSVRVGRREDSIVLEGLGVGLGFPMDGDGNDEGSNSNNNNDGSDREAIQSNKLDHLMNMGYDRQTASQALSVSRGDLDQAVNFLLMGDSRAGFLSELRTSFRLTDNSADSALAAALQDAEFNPPQRKQPESAMYNNSEMRFAAANAPKMVATEASLQTDGAGPFCTCVAASKFLNGGIMTAEGLNAMLEGGIELFRKANSSKDYTVAKVMSKFGKSHLKLDVLISGDDEPKEGVFIEQDLKHATGLRKKLAQCRIDQGTGWGVIIMETSSETFCICFPPKGSKNKFWYFDFTPRPQFRVPGAYARVHSSLLQLEESLESILKQIAEKEGKEFASFALYTVRKVK